MEQELSQVLELLKEKKVRVTPQRKAILEYLMQSKEHPTAEQIFREVSKDFGSMSLATVYNTMNIFSHLNIVEEMKFNGITSHYDFKHHDHHHICCMYCGQIADVHYQDLGPLIQYAQKETGYKVISANVELIGICQACQLKQDSLKNNKTNK